MELSIFANVILLIVVVLQWAQFRHTLKEKNYQIEHMRNLNHTIASRMWEITTENSSLKLLLGKKVWA